LANAQKEKRNAGGVTVGEEEVIVVNIKEGGEVSVSTPQSRGKSCKKLSKFLEEGLGTVVETKYTSAYYEDEEVKVKRKIRNGGTYT